MTGKEPVDAALTRFLAAQGPVIDRVMDELRAGRKRSHWMWFVFPQVSGLGRSAMAERYAIRSPDEARAYLAHPVLAPRLRAATRAVMRHGDKPLRDILGTPDDLKFVSSMTLFAGAATALDEPFAEALTVFGAKPDPHTRAWLAREDAGG